MISLYCAKHSQNFLTSSKEHLLKWNGESFDAGYNRMYEQKTIYISINKLARCNKEVELVLLFLNIRRISKMFLSLSKFRLVYYYVNPTRDNCRQLLDILLLLKIPSVKKAGTYHTYCILNMIPGCFTHILIAEVPHFTANCFVTVWYMPPVSI